MHEEMILQRVLGRARQLVQRGWCQHVHAMTANGAVAAFDSSDAVAWCAHGAIGTAVGELVAELPGFDRPLALMDRVAALVHASPLALIRWNDAPGRTQEEVLRAFDRALGGK